VSESAVGGRRRTREGGRWEWRFRRSKELKEKDRFALSRRKACRSLASRRFALRPWQLVSLELTLVPQENEHERGSVLDSSQATSDSMLLERLHSPHTSAFLLSS
jgi:hypothetical protein